MNYGTAYRAKPLMRVRKGLPDQKSSAYLTESYPPKTGQAIKSGMLCTLVKSGSIWELVKATATNSLESGDATYSGLLFWALVDQDSPHTEACGRLLVLSCTGGFEIDTPYHDAGTDLTPGRLIAAGATAGVATGIASNTGDVSVCGVVKDGLVNLVDATYPNNNQNSEADPATPVNSQMLNIYTCFIPAHAHA